MILIKDRHNNPTINSTVIVIWGNMILIKDRHWNMYQQMVSFQIGKYDTYKGSTLKTRTNVHCFNIEGNMILIKDRHSYVSSSAQ